MIRIALLVFLVILQTVVVGPVCADFSGGFTTPPGPAIAPGTEAFTVFPVYPVPGNDFQVVVVSPIVNPPTPTFFPPLPTDTLPGGGGG